MTPIIILGGESGSGKDTIANYMVKNHRAIAVAQSGPMKRFCQKVFDFTDHQLWGPSQARNEIDPRPNTIGAWEHYRCTFAKNMEDEWLDIGMGYYWAEMVAWFNTTQEYCLIHGMTPRYVLQTYGTEFGRNCRKDVWVEYAYRTAKSILGGGYTYTEKEGLMTTVNPVANWVVITDGRFPNELYKIKEASGFAIKITGTNTSAAAQTAGVKNHASETSLAGIPPEWYNYIFQNDKALGLQACEEKVAKLMGLLASPRYL